MKKDYVLLSFLAALSFFVQALAWPLAAGRDGFSYLYYAYDFFSAAPEDRFTLQFRTPLAPLFDWFLVNALPAWGAELFMGAIYVSLILLCYRTGLFWSRRLGLVFAGLLLLHFGWGSLFHVISNDPPIAILIPLLMWSTLRAASGNGWKFFLPGVVASLLSLARPGIFPALVLLPLLLWQLPWRTRITGVMAFALPCLVLLGGWCFWNYEKHGQFAVAPGADVVLPLGRVLAQEQILREENGPQSKILAEAVRSDLIPAEAKPMSVNEYFLAHPAYFDYMLLAEKRWGNYSVIKGAAWEAVRTYPRKYFMGVSKTILLTFAGNLKEPVPLRNGARVHTHKGHVSYTLNRKDQWVPISEFDFHAPLGSDGVQEEMAQKGPHSVRAWAEISSYPRRNGVIAVGSILNWLAYLFPPMLLWGFAALLVFRPGWKFTALEITLGYIWLLCLATNVLASFSIWSVVYEYRLPFDPAYILMGLLGLARLRYFRKITEA